MNLIQLWMNKSWKNLTQKEQIMRESEIEWKIMEEYPNTVKVLVIKLNMKFAVIKLIYKKVPCQKIVVTFCKQNTSCFE